MWVNKIRGGRTYVCLPACAGQVVSCDASSSNSWCTVKAAFVIHHYHSHWTAHKHRHTHTYTHTVRARGSHVYAHISSLGSEWSDRGGGRLPEECDEELHQIHEVTVLGEGDLLGGNGGQKTASEICFKWGDLETGQHYTFKHARFRPQLTLWMWEEPDKAVPALTVRADIAYCEACLWSHAAVNNACDLKQSVTFLRHWGYTYSCSQLLGGCQSVVLSVPLTTCLSQRQQRSTRALSAAHSLHTQKKKKNPHTCTCGQKYSLCNHRKSNCANKILS